MAKLKRLVTKRQQQRAIVERTASFCESLDPDQLTPAICCQLESRLKSIETAFAEYSKIQNEIELLEKDANIGHAERIDFETIFYDLQATIKNMLKNYASSGGQPEGVGDPEVPPNEATGPLTTAGTEVTSAHSCNPSPMCDNQTQVIQEPSNEPSVNSLQSDPALQTAINPATTIAYNPAVTTALNQMSTQPLENNGNVSNNCLFREGGVSTNGASSSGACDRINKNQPNINMFSGFGFNTSPGNMPVTNVSASGTGQNTLAIPPAGMVVTPPAGVAINFLNPAGSSPLSNQSSTPTMSAMSGMPGIFNPYFAPQFQLPNVQFPVMNLPKFDGHFDKWVEFKECFKALIEANPLIPEVIKLHHLRSCLSGDALEAVRAIPITAGNYMAAWRVLSERYERNQLIVFKHINELLNLSPLSRESSKDLRALFNTVNNNLLSLKNLNEPIEYWDSLLIQIVSTRLDFNSKREWEKMCVKGQRKTFQDLLSLIKNRCEILGKLDSVKNKASQLKPENEKNIQGYRERKLFRTSGYVSSASGQNCEICQADHPIYSCELFKKLTPEDRVTLAQKRSLCLNCLKKGHITPQCTSGVCKECGKKHHTLLHVTAWRKSKRVVEKSLTHSANLFSKQRKLTKGTNNAAERERKNVTQSKTDAETTSFSKKNNLTIVNNSKPTQL